MAAREITSKDIENQIKLWQDFVDRQKKKVFKLNPDQERVKSLAKGVLNNEEMRGVKFCPCRIRTKDFEKDAKLVCPCSFKMQTTWKEKGECWCSLFVKA